MALPPWGRGIGAIMALPPWGRGVCAIVALAPWRRGVWAIVALPPWRRGILLPSPCRPLIYSRPATAVVTLLVKLLFPLCNELQPLPLLGIHHHRLVCSARERQAAASASHCGGANAALCTVQDLCNLRLDEALCIVLAHPHRRPRHRPRRCRQGDLAPRAADRAAPPPSPLPPLARPQSRSRLRPGF